MARERANAPGSCAGAGQQKFEGRITHLEPLRLLAHTWKWGEGESDVTYQHEPRGKEVLLTIHHRLAAAPFTSNLRIGGK
jgi:uncharacterized protein YndB with AHSA1/START domain